MDLLGVPYSSDPSLKLMQWPLFLLASKVWQNRFIPYLHVGGKIYHRNLFCDADTYSVRHGSTIST
jgi:hypothetical protein